jgi:hypothetical protein
VIVCLGPRQNDFRFLPEVHVCGTNLRISFQGTPDLKSRVFHEVVRVICEEPPQRPSTAVLESDERIMRDGKTRNIAPGILSQTREGTPVDLRRRLAGDLDNMILKALEKDAFRRYRSAEQFRVDVDRHLNGQPVMARENTLWIRAGRLLGRHKIAFMLGASFLAAVVTGGVRIQWSGLAYLAGGVVLLGLWCAATDRQWGSRIAEFFSAAPAFVIMAGLLCLAVLSKILPQPVPWFGELWLLAASMAVPFLYFWTRIGGWIFRRRWGGELLLKVKIHDQITIATGVFAVVAIFSAAKLLNDLLNGCAAIPHDFVLPLAYGSMVLFGLLSSRFEIRERGLICRGQLIRWVNIRGYSWESSESSLTLLLNPERQVLRLEVRRLFHFLSSPRVHINQDHRGAVESIMARHISTWPE